MSRGSAPTALLVTSMAHVGGTEVATSIQARALVGAGWRVAVLGEPGPLCEAMQAAGVEFIPAGIYARNPLVRARALGSLLRNLRRLRPEVVHCQMARPVPMAWAAIRLAGLGRKTKLFWTSRGLHAQTYPRIVPIFNRLGVRALGNCATEEAKLIRFGMTPARCSHIYNAYRLSPADRRPARPPEPPLVIGTLAALRPDRRIDHFLRMAQHVAQALGPGRAVEFRIAGDGPERARLEAMAAELGLAEQVRFLGNVVDVPGFLRTVHVQVNTAFSEHRDWGAGLSNAIIEAMVVGVPMVAYDAAGISEILRDGDTGRLVPPGELEALSAAVLDLARDPDRAEALADAAHRNIVAACDPAAVLDRLLRLYREL